MKSLEGMTTARSEFDTLADGQVADVTRLIRSPRDWRELRSGPLRHRENRRVDTDGGFSYSEWPGRLLAQPASYVI
jgi:hypothetical protein